MPPMHSKDSIGFTSALRGVPFLAWRLWLDTPGVMATVSMLRGAWGKALQDLDPYVYRAVFRVQEAGDNTASPRYVIRPAPPDPRVNPAIDFIVFGSAVRHQATLLEAWKKAAEFGLRAGSKRIPFHIRGLFDLRSDGSWAPHSDTRQFETLADVYWPLDARSVSENCRLYFPTATRLQESGAIPQKDRRNNLRLNEPSAEHSENSTDRGRTIDNIDLFMIVDNLLSRIERIHVEPHAVQWELLRIAGKEAAATIRTTWQGEEFDYLRTSRQYSKDSCGKSEPPRVVETEIYGCRGVLTLLDGPGDLTPLLAAAQWLHVGKNFTEGLGEVIIR